MAIEEVGDRGEDISGKGCGVRVWETRGQEGDELCSGGWSERRCCCREGRESADFRRKRCIERTFADTA